MHAIVILDGISLRDFDTERGYRQLPTKIGASEIARLMGSGRQFGHGPLARFLQRIAARAGADSTAVTWLMIIDQEPQQSGGEDVDPQQKKNLIEHEFADHVTFIGTQPGRVPWQSILDAIDYEPQPPPQNDCREDARILLLGFPTDGRILTLGQLFRNMLGYPEVAVCPHLVGSLNPDAHFAALQHSFPAAGIKVLLDLTEAGRYVGLEGEELDDLTMPACQIDPPEVLAQLSAEQIGIIQRICMQWTRVELQPLQGGFSGSLLLLARGSKDRARTEPMVIKVDHAAQMQREIDGYHQINDYVSRQVPKIGYPIAEGDWIGVGMALAALDGRPWTLQEFYEGAMPREDPARADADRNPAEHFLTLLTRALALLSEKLYYNTHKLIWLAPYRELGLHTEETLLWFDENMAVLQQYADELGIPSTLLSTADTRAALAAITANENMIDTDVCLAHGDLNFKNIIVDDAGNIWFIDWTHTGMHPVETDFAKLENDLKFILSRHFDESDLPRLQLFEEFLLNNRIPPPADALEGALQFVKWDLRYRNILSAVILIRRACFALKQSERWLCYRITLLKLGLHTLSFDQRREQGECGPFALLHAAISVQSVVRALAVDDYQTRISGARPFSYPRRQRVAVDEAPWCRHCPDYRPPYHVDPVVLENNRFDNSYGWADPETLDPSWWQIPPFPPEDCDSAGRPLNPAGRTGLAGRGLLGRWGANPAVSAIIIRGDSSPVELLVGRREGPESLWLPHRFLLPGETTVDGFWQMIQDLTTYRAPLDEALEQFSTLYDAGILHRGQVDDPRQTDHAWVETSTLLIQLSSGIVHGAFGPTQVLGEVEWRPLLAATVNALDPVSALLLRLALRQLHRKGSIDRDYVQSLLLQTGRAQPC